MVIKTLTTGCFCVYSPVRQCFSGIGCWQDQHTRTHFLDICSKILKKSLAWLQLRHRHAVYKVHTSSWSNPSSLNLQVALSATVSIHQKRRTQNLERRSCLVATWCSWSLLCCLLLLLLLLLSPCVCASFVYLGLYCITISASSFFCLFFWGISMSCPCPCVRSL